MRQNTHHSKVIVGVDPASTGAIVVLNGDLVQAVALWKPCHRQKKKAYKLSISSNNKINTIIVRTAAHIGNIVGSLPCLSYCHGIAVEDTYVSKNPKTAIYLARISGSISAPMEVKSGLPAFYVRANTWRSVVLGINKRLGREQLKKISLNDIPKILPSLKKHLDILGHFDHITDAAGIALWLKSKEIPNR